MMKDIISKKNQQEQLNQMNNEETPFVRDMSGYTHNFKYKFPLRLSKYTNEKLIALKNTCTKTKQAVQLKLNMFDFKAAGAAMMVWLMNAFVEGLVVNFVVWGLLGWRFNIITIMAYGMAVKYSLDLYWRIKINGKHARLPEKH